MYAELLHFIRLKISSKSKKKGNKDLVYEDDLITELDCLPLDLPKPFPVVIILFLECSGFFAKLSPS